MRRAMRNRMPQVAVLLETSHGISRMEFRGILKYVNAHGPWSLHATVGGPRELRVPDMRHWRGDGVIGRVATDAIARGIVASGLPAVLFNPADRYLEPAHPLSRCSRTASDSEAVGRLAADYYLGRAFLNFAFVGEAGGINWSVRRGRAFADRLAEAGRRCGVYPLPPRRRAAWTAERPLLCAWLRSLPKPVSIFAANDARARQVLDACLVAGIGVPYEAAVLGVNNDDLICETCIPPLSSIALDAERAGYEAARILDERMRGADARRRIVTYGPTGVASRASTDTVHVRDRLVIRALEFIRINRGLVIRVPDIADHAGVSRRWLEMRFRLSLGHSVHTAIHRARLAAVRAMLEKTDLPVAAIAKACGFAHPNHLCAVFKREFGRTMTAYRAGTARA